MNDASAGILYRSLVALRAIYAKTVAGEVKDEHKESIELVLKKVDEQIVELSTVFAQQPDDLKIPMPICPNPACKMDPMKFIIIGVMIPPGIIGRVVTCVGCRTALNVQIIGQQQQSPRVAGAGAPGPGLWVPGMKP